MKLRHAVFAFLALALLSGGLIYWRLTIRTPGPVEGVAADPPSTQPAETEQEKTRRKLLGVWRDHYKGERTMTLKDDGTGTMLVELSGLQAKLFAPKLRFDMRWSLEGNILKKRSIGGEPAFKVKAILEAMGDTAEETILELTDDHLLLLDKDGEQKYDWKRSEPVKD